MHARARTYIQIPRKYGEQRHTATQTCGRNPAVGETQFIHQQYAKPDDVTPYHHVRERYDRLPQT